MLDKINCFCLNILADSTSSEKKCLLESQKLKKKYGSQTWK